MFWLAAGGSYANEEVGNRACAGCHAEIYRKFIATGMARSAGTVGTGESWDRASFIQDGVRYRLRPDRNGYAMEFDRTGTGVQGRRQLEWFVGSGGLGRSYLFSMDGFLYQAPVSYYSSSASWRISPGYETRRGIDLTRAVETGCLQCHASRLRPVAGTQNRFAVPPFLEPGVSCERCHGPGRDHVSARGAGRASRTDIVNPATLSPERRDSVCAQCHLTGAARVARKAKSGTYRPGDLLSASLAVFVWAEGSSEPNATSHYERLNQSACKRASGEKLWCGTCHNPHGAAEAAEYRKTCMSCHGANECTEGQAARRANGDDCTACHMPKSDSRMVEHVAFTDHGIVRRKAAAAATPRTRTLAPFWRDVEDRDLALAYAVAAMTEPGVRRHALGLLEAAAERDPRDVPVLAQLAQFYDRLGREQEAADLCERVLKLDPWHIAAAVNLGTYRVKRGDVEGAIRLWNGALQRNPALTGPRLNLAVAQFRSGQATEAEASLRIALEYDPDSEAARKMLAEVRAARR